MSQLRVPAMFWVRWKKLQLLLSLETNYVGVWHMDQTDQSSRKTSKGDFPLFMADSMNWWIAELVIFPVPICLKSFILNVIFIWCATRFVDTFLLIFQKSTSFTFGGSITNGQKHLHTLWHLNLTYWARGWKPKLVFNQCTFFSRTTIKLRTLIHHNKNQLFVPNKLKQNKIQNTCLFIPWTNRSRRCQQEQSTL